MDFALSVLVMGGILLIKSTVRIQKLIIAGILFFIVLPITSTIYTAALQGVDINSVGMVSLFGNVRLLAVFGFALLIGKDKPYLYDDLMRYVLLYCVLIILVGYVEFFIPELRENISSLYSTKYTEELANEILIFFRIKSSVNHPANFSLVCLIALIIVFNLRCSKMFAVAIAILAFVAGVLSASKTFLFGIVVLILQFVITGRAKGVLGAVIVCATVFGFVILFASDFDFKVIQLITNLMDKGVMSSLQTRFGSDGFLNSSIDFLTGNNGIGVGFNYVENVFQGDSLYLTISMQSSVYIALILTAIMLVHYFIQILNKNTLQSDLLIVLLACGVGYPSFFGTRTGEVVMLLLGFLISYRAARCSMTNEKNEESYIRN